VPDSIVDATVEVAELNVAVSVSKKTFTVSQFISA
jgi:hypothetical protein